jgi:transposase-like protein
MAKGKRFASAQKFSAALSVISGEKSAVEAAKELGCHPAMVGVWKTEIEQHGEVVFERASEAEEKNRKIAKLERMIGALTLENGFLERVLGRSDGA